MMQLFGSGFGLLTGKGDLLRPRTRLRSRLHSIFARIKAYKSAGEASVWATNNVLYIIQIQYRNMGNNFRLRFMFFFF